MGSGRDDREPAAAEAGGGIEPDPGGTDGFASRGTTGGIAGIDRGVIGGIDAGGSDAGGMEGGCMEGGGGIERGVAGAGDELASAGGIERVFFGRGGTSGAGGGAGAGCGRATGVRCGGRGTAFLGGSSSFTIRRRSVQDFAPVR